MGRVEVHVRRPTDLSFRRPVRTGEGLRGGPGTVLLATLWAYWALRRRQWQRAPDGEDSEMEEVEPQNPTGQGRPAVAVIHESCDWTPG